MRPAYTAAIDDFGTGYSSFIQLQHFAVDVIKIDRTFTAGLVHTARDRELARTVISMGHAMDVQVRRLRLAVHRERSRPARFSPMM